MIVKKRNRMFPVGFRSERERLLYLFEMIVERRNITCLNEVLDKMNESHKEMILAILDEKE